MRVGSTFNVAFRALRRNKLRSALTALGIIIGVGAVIAMVGIGSGAKAQVEAQIASLGQNVIVISSGSTTSSGIRTGWGGAGTLKIEDAEAIRRELPNVTAVSEEVPSTAQVAAGNQNWFTRVMGESPDYFDIRQWPLAEGAPFTAQDVRSDLCDNVTCLHFGIKIGEKFLDIPRNLTAHLHVYDRVQCARGGNRLRDRTARHRRGLKLSSVRPSQSAKKEKRGDQKDDCRDDKIAAIPHFASRRGHIFIMTSERPAPLHRNLLDHAAQLAHSRDEFQGQFHSLDAGGSALVPRPNCLFQHHLWLDQSDR